MPPLAAGDCPVEPVRVVVSVGQWGDIVGDLAGACGKVTTIISGTSVDPHDYEPTPSDLAAFTDAELVVVNGLGYDAWAESGRRRRRREAGRRRCGRGRRARPKATTLTSGTGPTSSAPSPTRSPASSRTRSRRDAVLRRAGDGVAAARCSRTTTRWPSSAPRRRRRDLRRDRARVRRTWHKRSGSSTRRRRATAAAAANGVDPAPGDLHDFLAGPRRRARSTVLVVQHADRGRRSPSRCARAAESAGVPVVEVTEAASRRHRRSSPWQLDQLRGLADAATRAKQVTG